MNDWEGTDWAGTAVAEPAYPHTNGHRDMATVEAKAATGIGVGFYGPNIPVIDSLTRTPQGMMKRAQDATRTNPWIRSAERAVTSRVRGLPWHLEDSEGNEYKVEDSLPQEVRRVIDLLERPTARIPLQDRQPTTVTTWERLVGITSRHVGPCGMGYWYLDQMDTDRLPESILYVNPARVWPAEDGKGNLTGWVLDPKDSTGRGGTPLKLNELLPFYLDSPDWGHIGAGLYEAAILKAQLTSLADSHSAYVLGTGGRIAGIVAPKEGFIEDEKFKTLVAEFRNVNEAPDAAKRTTIMQGPTDFIPTAADPEHLQLVELARMNRDDIFTIWGVPQSQAPVAIAAGMNSGDTKGYDEAILYQGPVHDRVRAIVSTVQYLLLDRWKAIGVDVNLIIEEPEFDDDTPKYDKAAKARDLPLRNKERRELVGLEPFGDDRDEEVWLPSVISVAYEAGGQPPAPVSTPPTVAGEVTEPVAKSLQVNVKRPHNAVYPYSPPAKSKREFLGLRRSVETRWVPKLRKALGNLLAEQRAEVVKKVRSASPDAIRRHRKDPDYWWNAKREDERLSGVVRPVSSGIGASVASRTSELLKERSAKADTFSEQVATEVLGKVGSRIKGINQTTRDAVAEAIAEGYDQGLAPSEIAELLEGLPAFDDARAEMVARTESAFAYNTAALSSYTEFGVTQVEAIDGDEDEECAARNGQTFPVAEAFDIMDHPNGTLDWVPVI